MKKINVLGVDQGLANVGFAIVELDLETFELELIEHGTVRTKAKDSKAKRIEQIGMKVLNLIESNDVSHIGTEKLFTTGTSGNASFGYRDGVTDGNFVTGVLYYIAGMKDCEINQYPPTTVKKQVTGSGKATKERVEERVREIFDFDSMKKKPSNHAMDAIAIAITTINKDILKHDRMAG